MEVISNTVLNNMFKKIDGYRMDLGFAIKTESKSSGKDKSSKWIIKDNIVKKYYEMKNVYITKTGKIGTLSFYIDNQILDDEIYIINDNNVYKSEFDKNTNIKIELSKVLFEIYNGNIDPYEKISQTIEKDIDLKNMDTKELLEHLRKNG